MFWFQFEEQASLATRMLVVMVMSYLVSKTLNFVLLVWEYIDVESLESFEFLYTYSSQFSNIMALMGD